MYPFAISGRVATALRTQSEMQELVDRLAATLRQRGVSPEVKGSEILFVNNKGFPLVHPFELFKSVENGSFMIGQFAVDYRLSSAVGAVLVLSMVGAMLLLGLVAGSYLLVCFAGVSILGMLASSVETNWRVRRLLRRLANPTP